MNKKRSVLIFTVFILVLLLVLSGCDMLMKILGDEGDPEGEYDDYYDQYQDQFPQDQYFDPYDYENVTTEISLTANLAGAKAIATKEEISGKASYLTKSGVKSDSEDAFDLVKVLDDGSLEAIFDILDEQGYMPKIQFIKVMPDKTVLVSFEQTWVTWVEAEAESEEPTSKEGEEAPAEEAPEELPPEEDPYYEDPSTTYTDGEYKEDEFIDDYKPPALVQQIVGNFIHILSDGTIRRIMPIIDTPDEWAWDMQHNQQVNNWQWWGDDNYKPVEVDNNGNVYFNYRKYDSSGNINALYIYDSVNGTVMPLTPELEGYNYNSFQVDPLGQRLFVKGERSTISSQSQFFRMYPIANMSNPKTIYYSSQGDIWVRGYKISPAGDFLVMNGWNVRGINGICKVNILSDTELTYDPLYDSDSQNWFDPVYREEYRDWESKTYYFGLFDEMDRWRARILMTDGTNFRYADVYQFYWTRNEWVPGYEEDSNGVAYYWINEGYTDVGGNWQNGYYQDEFGNNFLHIPGHDEADDGTWLPNLILINGHEEDADGVSYIHHNGYWDNGTWIEDSYEDEYGTVYNKVPGHDEDDTGLDYSYDGGNDTWEDENGIIYSNVDGSYEDGDGNIRPDLHWVNEYYEDSNGNWLPEIHWVDGYHEDSNGVKYSWINTGYNDVTGGWHDGYYQDEYGTPYYNIPGHEEDSNGNWLPNRSWVDGYEVQVSNFDYPQFDFWDNANQTDCSVFIGDEANPDDYTFNTQWWFATSETDPTQKATESTLNDFMNNGGTPIYKLEWWYRDQFGEHQVYKDIPQNVVDYFTDPDNNVERVYVWDEHWYVDQDYATGQLDTEAIMEYIGTYFIEDVEFDFDGSTGEAGFAAALSAEPYVNSEVRGPTGSDNWFYLTQHVVKAGTTDPAKTFQQFKQELGVGWLDFQGVGNMFFDSTGSLWGILGGGDWWSGGAPKPIKLLDQYGDKDLKIVDAFTGNTLSPVGFVIDGDFMYFRNSELDYDGFETGYHKMYRFDIRNEAATEEDMEDMLVSVPGNGTMEILDFSIGGSYLYFTAVQGISVIGGKVNLDTLGYTPFDSSARLSNIEVY